MSSLLSNAKIYAEKWNLVDTRDFDAEEKAAILAGIVVDSQYGKSVCFLLKAGGQFYQPLSSNSKLKVGDRVSTDSARVETLEKTGEEPIYRVIEK